MIMKQNNKQELSYFRLKLRSYMSEHHPERLKDMEFIITRADMALTTYCDAVAEGFTHPEAESMASDVLYQGLHFSKYDTLVSVLENEFEGNCLYHSLRSSHPYCCRTRLFKPHSTSSV